MRNEVMTKRSGEVFSNFILLVRIMYLKLK